MSEQPDYTSIVAYMAHDASNLSPDEALKALRAIESRLATKGLTLAAVMDDVLYPQRKLARMPDEQLSSKNWRPWIVYLFARRDEMPEKDERHLRVCFTQTGWLKKWQMRWIYDILARIEPAGCGTWGAPD